MLMPLAVRIASMKRACFDSLRGVDLAALVFAGLAALPLAFGAVLAFALPDFAALAAFCLRYSPSSRPRGSLALRLRGAAVASSASTWLAPGVAPAILRASALAAGFALGSRFRCGGISRPSSLLSVV